jgi:hypothetical protein
MTTRVKRPDSVDSHSGFRLGAGRTPGSLEMAAIRRSPQKCTIGRLPAHIRHIIDKDRHGRVPRPEDATAGDRQSQQARPGHPQQIRHPEERLSAGGIILTIPRVAAIPEVAAAPLPVRALESTKSWTSNFPPPNSGGPWTARPGRVLPLGRARNLEPAADGGAPETEGADVQTGSTPPVQETVSWEDRLRRLRRPLKCGISGCSSNQCVDRCHPALRRPHSSAG